MAPEQGSNRLNMKFKDFGRKVVGRAALET